MKINVKFLVMAVSALFMLTACEPIKGKLHVSESFQLNKRGKVVQVNPGTIKTVLEYLPKKDKLEMKLKKFRSNGKDMKINFKIPAGTDMPTGNGTIELLSEDSGQPVDLFAALRTVHHRTETERTTESCTGYYYERVCRYNNQGHRVCRDVRRTTFGTQRVEFHYNVETKSLALTLSDADVEVAEFGGSRVERNKVYDYQGVCRINGHYPRVRDNGPRHREPSRRDRRHRPNRRH